MLANDASHYGYFVGYPIYNFTPWQYVDTAGTVLHFLYLIVFLDV